MKLFMNLLIIAAVFATGLAGNAKADFFNDSSQKAKQRAMCYSNYEDRVNAILIDKVPSIMEECGIGGLFDFCGKLGKFGSVFGSALGCGGGSGGGGSSNFCDWGFNKDSAKEAWKVYKGASVGYEQELQYASVAHKHRAAAEVLGLTFE